MRYHTFISTLAIQSTLASLVGTSACQLGSTPVYLNDELQSSAGAKASAAVASVGGGPSQRSSVQPIHTVGVGGNIGAATGVVNETTTQPSLQPAFGESTAGASSIISAGGSPMDPTGFSTSGGRGGATPSGTGGVVSFAGSAQTPELAAACAAPETGTVIDSTLEAVKQMLVGEWLICSAAMCNSDIVGLEVRADGTWFDLTRDGSGNLVHAQGSARYGIWNLVDSGISGWPGRYVISRGYGDAPSLTPGGSVILSPEGAKLNGGPSTCVGTYVRATEVTRLAASQPTGKWIGNIPVESTPVPVVQPSSLTSACKNPPSEVWPCSTPEELRTGLLGTWQMCPGSICSNCHLEDGTELLSDGTFYNLYADVDGQLYRGRGWFRRGHWRTLSVDSGTDGSLMHTELVLDGRSADERERAALYGTPIPTYWNAQSMAGRSYVRVNP